MDRSGGVMRRSPVLLAILLVAAGSSWTGEAAAAVPVGPFHADHVWPLSGTTTPEVMASPYGPRLKYSEHYRYDFHRGIDIPTPYGSPVYASSYGTVRIAGVDPNYSDPLVQIRHHRPGHRYCGSVGCYYTNYMHLSAWVVAPGQQVRTGQLIGYSGASASGFPHLHFEIRDGGIYQKYCINPLYVLPYDDEGAPPRPDVSVNASIPGHPLVAVEVTLPPDELDLDAVTVHVYGGNPNREISEQSYDMTEWNRLYTPTYDPTLYLDDPRFNGVRVTPDPFNEYSGAYRVGFQFDELSGPRNPARLHVFVDVRDVLGQVTEEEIDGPAR